MTRSVRIDGMALRAIAYGSEKTWKNTCKRLRGILHDK